MKILDAQGRLFGKINVIDFLALMFLISLTPMFYFGYKIFNKKPPEAQTTTPIEKNFLETEIDLTFTKLDAGTTKLISVGDKETDQDGKAIGEIVTLGKPKPLSYDIDLGSGLKTTKDDPELKQIPVTLKIKAEVKDNSLYYKDAPIKVNSLIEFRTSKYSARALFLPAGFSPVEGKNDTLALDLMKSLLEQKTALLNQQIEQKTTLLNQEINLLKNKIAALETISKEEKTPKKKK